MTGIIILFIAAFLQYVACQKTTCTPSVVKKGHSARITCGYDTEIIQAKLPIVVKKLDGSSPDEGKTILECVWSSTANYTCNVDPNFTCDCRHLQSLTLTIPSAVERYTGKYSCRTVGSESKDTIPCEIKLADKQPLWKGLYNHDSNSTSVHVKVIRILAPFAFLIVLVLAVILFRKRIRNKCCRRRDHTNKLPKAKSYSYLRLSSEDHDLRKILVVGKTGSGKSTLCNVLLGEKQFETGNGWITTTKHCESRKSEHIEVIDTPDLWNLRETCREAERRKLEDFLAKADVIILAVRYDVVYTPSELEVYDHLKYESGDPVSFCKRLVVAFTFGDRALCAHGDSAGDGSEELRKVLADARGRSVVFCNSDDRAMSQEESQSRLWAIIRDMIQEANSTPANDPFGKTGEGLDEPTQTLLLIGKSGNGKSSVGNTLLGFDFFKTGAYSSSPTTLTAKAEECNPMSPTTNLKVVDTPDISKWPDDQQREEVSRWRQLTYPGPDVVLLVIRCDVTYTTEEYAIYQQLKMLWGESGFFPRLILVFTFADQQEFNIEHKMNESSELKQVLNESSGRYVVICKSARQEEKMRSVRLLQKMLNDLKRRPHALFDCV